MKLKLFLPLLIISLLSCALVFAKKTYNVTIELNKTINYHDLRLYVDDGKSQKEIEIKDTQNLKISIRGDYYALYAMIKLTYAKKGSLVEFFENRFFVEEKAATIILKENTYGKSPFENYALINALDFKREKDRMNEYTIEEENNVQSFLLKHDKDVNYGADTSVQNEYYRLNNKVQKKYLSYILKNGSSYFAFVYFRRNLLNLLPADSMLRIFDKTFPVKFKNSEEGNTIKKYFTGKLTIKLNNIAPDFDAKDIKGSKIILSSFRNKKYVLLIFWATWCGPCMAEIPKIKELYDKYSGDELEIISVAYNSIKYAIYLKAVNENKMTWTNIYNDADLLNTYSSEFGIPRIYLIDKSGKIIYDKLAENGLDIDLKNLEKKLNDLLK